MNKADIIERVHEKLGGTKTTAEDAVETIFANIVSAMKNGDEVSIAGFGIFSAKNRPARMARNPRTGASVQVPATRVPKFRAGKALKEAMK